MSANERPLSLHISALSPEEFEHYTALLGELAGPGQDDRDGFWDRPVPVLEARGYLRGRYQLELTVLDKVSLGDPFDMSETGWEDARPSLQASRRAIVISVSKIPLFPWLFDRSCTISQPLRMGRRMCCRQDSSSL